jgi:hypothetical protein
MAAVSINPASDVMGEEQNGSYFCGGAVSGSIAH